MFEKYKNGKIDKAFKKLGYKKVRDSNLIVQYARYDEKFKDTQHIDIVHKASGRHIIQSYGDVKSSDSCDFAAMWGMTFEEARLALKKANAKGWT